MNTENIPYFLFAAMIAAIAHKPLDIFDVHARNLGTVKALPWLSKVSATVTAATASIVGMLWRNHRRLLSAAAVMICLLVMPDQSGAADQLGAGVAVAGSIAELERKHDALALAALEARNRDLDPETVRKAFDAAGAAKMQLLRARQALNNEGAFTEAFDRATNGLQMPGLVRGVPSLGAQFVNSDTFKWLQKNKGKLPTGGVWTSESSELPGLAPVMAATLTSDAASGGDLIVTDFQDGILPLPTRPLTVADLLASGTTNSNAVGYMKETTATNAAATVAEGLAKPESTLIFDQVIDPVRKIATWIPVTEEMLEDVPAIMAYINTRLRLFVQIAEDDQLLNGDGTAPNISGILDRPGIGAPLARTTETNPDVILKKISAIETATNLQVDGIVMHPSNWDSVLLLKDADGNYIAGGGPFTSPQRKTLWGRNVAVTTAIAANTALVGAFKTAAQFFRRGGLRVESSNSHADFYIKNLVAVRAEERGALCVYRESAFALVTNLTAA